MLRAPVLATCAWCAGCDAVLHLETVPPPPDAPTICFSDHFDSDVIDPDRWTVTAPGTTSVAETGGQLVFTLGQTNSYATIRSVALDFEGSAIEIQLVQAPIEDGHEETGLELAADQDNLYSFYSADGNLFFRLRMTGQQDIQTQIQYSASIHRFLRIRHDTAMAPTVHFETSADHMTWKAHASVPANVSLASATAGIYAGTYLEPGPASTAIYDDFAMTGACPPPP